MTPLRERDQIRPDQIRKERKRFQFVAEGEREGKTMALRVTGVTISTRDNVENFAETESFDNKERFQVTTDQDVQRFIDVFSIKQTADIIFSSRSLRVRFSFPSFLPSHSLSLTSSLVCDRNRCHFSSRMSCCGRRDVLQES